MLGLYIYDYNVVFIGIIEIVVFFFDMNVKSIIILENNWFEFMLMYENIMLKVVYEEEIRWIVGV